jgi:hypothetical protein
MVARVSAVLNRCQTEWATQWPPEAILGACEAAGDPAGRDRGLTPVPTIPRLL